MDLDPRYLILVIGISTLCLACVGTGKYRTLEEENVRLETDLGKQVETLTRESTRLDTKVEEQRDEMIKQNTMIGQLLMEKSSLEEQVVNLTKQLDLLSVEAKSVQAELNTELQRRNEELARKEALLSRIIESYQLNQTKANTIVARLTESMSKHNNSELEVETDDLEARIVVYARFLFSSGLQLQPGGSQALDLIAEIIKDYPETTVHLEGHTDNTSPSATRQYEDAMDLSALRAATVMRYLIREADLNANQVIASGKAGFYPRVSNETPAGKAINNRVEIRIKMGHREMLQLVKGSQ